MRNRLTISQFPSNVTPKDFQRWFISTTEKAFKQNQNKEFQPMACMLVQGSMFTILPDFKNDETKSESMQQMKTLARLIQCKAFGFVSEGYMKTFTEEERETAELLIDAVDGKASMMPGRIEALFCSIELKGGKKTQTIWEINDRNLGPCKTISIEGITTSSGTVTNILS